MEALTRGFTPIKSIQQVLKAMVGLGYVIDKEEFKQINRHGVENYYRIPFSRGKEKRILGFGTATTSDFPLSNVLPKTGRKLKNAKSYSLISLEVSNSAYEMLPAIVGALGGGYVHFGSSNTVPAVEIDTNGKLIDKNKRRIENTSLDMMRRIIYFDKNDLLLTPPGTEEQVFLEGKTGSFRPILVYKHNSINIYVIYISHDSEFYVNKLAQVDNLEIFNNAEFYGKKNHVFATLKDIAY